MFFLLRITIRDHQIRRGLLWFLLATVTFALTGFVLLPAVPSAKVKPDSRFPCEHSSCGCNSAAHCWDRCCCHSDRQKLAWAERNGVTPPAFLLKRVSGSDSSDANSSQPACCQTTSDRAGSGPTATAERCLDQDPPKKRTNRTVLMWEAAECRGMTSLWTSLAAVGVPSSSPLLRLDPPVLDWIILVDQRAPSLFAGPEPPIPRYRALHT